MITRADLRVGDYLIDGRPRKAVICEVRLVRNGRDFDDLMRLAEEITGTADLVVDAEREEGRLWIYPK